MKVLQHKQTKKHRLILREEKTLKLRMNHFGERLCDVEIIIALLLDGSLIMLLIFCIACVCQLLLESISSPMQAAIVLGHGYLLFFVFVCFDLYLMTFQCSLRPRKTLRKTSPQP